MSVLLPELTAWDGFYTIVGSSAGALIGLQFVVMTLIPQRPGVDASEAGAVFSSPTIVHFGAVLLLAALLHVPWPAIGLVAGVWGLMGFAGVVYTAAVAWRMRKQELYEPAWDDWLFHVASPFIAYAILAAAWFAAFSYPSESLFGVGAAVLLLLFTGIHNAWDSAAYHVLVVRNRQD